MKMKKMTGPKRMTSLLLCFAMLFFQAGPYAESGITPAEEITDLVFTNEDPSGDFVYETADSGTAVEWQESFEDEICFEDEVISDDGEEIIEELIWDEDLPETIDETVEEDAEAQADAGSGAETGIGEIIDDGTDGGGEDDDETLFVSDEIYAVGEMTGITYYGYWGYREHHLKVKVERSTGVITAAAADPEMWDQPDVLYLPAFITPDDEDEPVMVTGAAENAFQNLFSYYPVIYVPYTIEAEAFDMNAFGVPGGGADPDPGVVVSKGAASDTAGTYSNLRIFGPSDEAWSEKASEYGFSYTPCILNQSEVSPSSAGTIGGETGSLTLYLPDTVWDMRLEITLTGQSDEGVYSFVFPAGENRYREKTITLELGSQNVPDGNYDVLIKNEDYGVSWTGWYHVDRTPPAAPLELDARQEESDILLTWAAGPEADLDHYLIDWLDENGGMIQDNIWIAADRTSWLCQETIPGNTYIFRVSAVDRFNQEGESAQITATAPEDAVKPVITRDLPDNVTAIGGSYDISVYATDNRGLTTEGYALEWKDGEEWKKLETAAPVYRPYYGWISFTLDTADPFFDELESITLRLSVTDIFGNTAYGEERTWRIDRTGPEQVTGLHTEETDYPSSTINLSWNAVNDADFSSYVLEKKVPGDSEEGEIAWQEVKRIDSQASVRLWNLTPGSTHVYRVYALDWFGNRGENSEELTVALAEDVTAPTVEYISTDRTVMSNEREDKVTLAIAVQDDSDVASLRIQTGRDTDEARVWTDAKTLTPSCNSEGKEQHVWYVYDELDISGYPEGTLYIRALPSDSTGNETAPVEELPFAACVIDNTPPEAPAGFMAAQEDGHVALSWEKSSEELSYYLLKRQTESIGHEDSWYISTVTDLGDRVSWMDDFVPEPETTYVYTLTAFDTADNESAEATFALTTSADSEKPEITELYPDEQRKLLQDSTIWVYGADNDSLAAIYVSYSTDGGQTWSDPEEHACTYVSYYYEDRRRVYTLELDPITDLPVPDSIESLTVRAWCVDAAGNISETREFTRTVDLTGPEVADFDVSLHDGYPVISWKENSEVTNWQIQRRRSDTTYFSSILGIYAYQASSYLSGDDGTMKWTDEYVTEGWRYTYRILATDTDGNRSYTETDGAYIAPGSLTDESAPTAVITGNLIGAAGREMAFSGDGSLDDRAVVSWSWDFGDGAVSSLVSPTHIYSTAGTYTVSLTVADKAGNTDSAQREVTILEPQSVGTVTVKVMEKGGGSVADAGIYFRLGSEDMTVLRTDLNGTAVLTAGEGSYPVGIYAPGYLPVSEEVRFICNAQLELTIEIEKQELVTGELTVKQMTLQEIKDAGIDVTDPANLNVVDFTTRLVYQGVAHSIHTYVRPDGTRVGGGTASFGGRNYSIHPLTGGGSFSWADHADRLGTAPPYAIIDIPGSASWLKDFFDVNLTVVNNAPAPFSLDDAIATLSVPEGLTLVDSNRTDADEIADMGTIPGGGSATAEWILRGDEPGSYELEAAFEAMLHDFNEPVSAVFKTDQPVVVRGGEDIWIDVLTERNVENTERPVVRIGIRTEGEDPLNCPHICLKKATLVRNFVTEGTGEEMQVIGQAGTDVLTKGQELWADYVITQESFATIQSYRESYEGQIASMFVGDMLRDAFNFDLQGLDVNFNFEIVPDHTIAATRIEIFMADGDGTITDLPVTYCYWGDEVDTLIGQKLPSLLVHTSFVAPNGEIVDGPTPLFIRDDYLTAEDDVYGEASMISVMTDAYGDYIYPGYEISHSAWVQSSPLGGGTSLADEHEVTRVESSTYYEISFASWRDEVEFPIGVETKVYESTTPVLTELAYLCMAKLAYKDLDLLESYHPGEDAVPLDEELIEEICNEMDAAGGKDYNKIQYNDTVKGVINPDDPSKPLGWSDVMKQCMVGWTIIDTERHNETGFFAATFTNGRDVVIAYRGSDELDLLKLFTQGYNADDWIINDVVMAVIQHVTPQMWNAFDYAEKVVKKYGTWTTVSATGHSLGGGLGILAANKLNIKAITFDSAPTLRASYYCLPSVLGRSFRGIDKWTYHCISNEKCKVGVIERDSKCYTTLATQNSDESVFGFMHHSPDALLYYDQTSGKFRLSSKTGSRTYAVGGSWRYDMTSSQVSEVLDTWIENDRKYAEGLGAVGMELLRGLQDFLKAPFELVEEAHTIAMQLGTSGDNKLHGIRKVWNDIPLWEYPNVIYGGDGNDEIRGGKWYDVLIGGRGNDILDGGTGADTYYYCKGDGEDTIVDLDGNDLLLLHGFSSGDVIEEEMSSSGLTIFCNRRAIIRIRPKLINWGLTKTGSIKVKIFNSNNSLRDERVFKGWDRDYTKKVTIACPVDVNVYDSQGTVVWTIRDGVETAVYEDFGTLYCTKADGSDDYIKDLYLADGYTVQATGTGTGTMYVFVTTADLESDGELTYEAANIAVQPGQIFTVDDVLKKISSETSDGQQQVIDMTLKVAPDPGNGNSGSDTPEPGDGGDGSQGAGNTGTQGGNGAGPTGHVHSWSAWTTDQEATVLQAERQVRSCLSCGEKEYRSVGSTLAPVLETTASSIVLKTRQSTKKFVVTMAAGDSVKSWTSGNKKIVTVKGKADGTCTIKAGKKTGRTTLKIVLASGKSASIPVKVQKGDVKTKALKVTAEGLSGKSLTLHRGEKVRLEALLTPFTSQDKVSYASSQKKIVSVTSKGVVKAKKTGSAKITVKAGKKKVVIRVVVK